MRDGRPQMEARNEEGHGSRTHERDDAESGLGRIHPVGTAQRSGMGDGADGGVELLVYFIYLMGTLKKSAREYGRQIAMEIQLAREITEQKAVERNLRDALTRNDKLVADLRSALEKVKTLSGLLPVCGWCHKVVRNDHGGWERIDRYLAARTNVQVSHGMCPECFTRVYEGE